MGLDLHSSHLRILHAALLGRALQHTKLHNQVCSACRKPVQGCTNLFATRHSLPQYEMLRMVTYSPRENQYSLVHVFHVTSTQQL